MKGELLALISLGVKCSINLLWLSGKIQDWTEQVRDDLAELGIQEDIPFIESKSQYCFKRLVKTKIKEFILDLLNDRKFRHTKMDNLVSTELQIQDYLVSEKFSVEQKRIGFLFSTMPLSNLQISCG